MKRFFRESPLLVLVVAIRLTSCQPVIAPSTPTLTHVKVAVFPFMTSAPLYLAQENGYFKAQGLDVEFVNLTNAADAIVALIQRQIDVYPSGLTTGLMNALVSDADIKIVADKGYFNPKGCAADGLVARKALIDSSQLNDSQHLKGLTVTYLPASFEAYYVEKWLNKAGLTLQDVHNPNIATAAELDAFNNGTIDLTATSEPFITSETSTGEATMWLSAAQIVPDFQFGVVVYGANLLTTSLDIGQHFMIAYLKGVRQFAVGKTDANIQVLAKALKLDPDVLNQICWPSFRGDGKIDTASVLDFEDWAATSGLLEKTATADQFWDSRFVDYANTQLGTP